MNTRIPVSIDGVVPWPDDVAAEYRRAGYWQGRSLASHIAEQVARRPDDEAVADGATRLTYRQLWDRAASCAQALLDLHIAPGDRIVLQLPNCWEFVALTLGCLRIGVVPVMALPAHRQHELTHLAAVAGAVAIVVADIDRDTDLRQVAQQVAVQVPSLRSVLVHGELSSGSPEYAPENSLRATFDTTVRFAEADYEPTGADVACMLLSGGTTGLPKLIVRTNDDYAYNILRCNEVSEFDSSTVYLGTLPCSHNFPLACPGVLGTLFVGGRAVMLPSPSPERALRTIDAESVTIAAVVPAIAQSWIEYQRERKILCGDSLRVLQVGGSRMPDELAARVEPVLGARLQQVFGMAEGLINMTRLDDDLEIILITQGRPVSDADEILVVDESGNPVPDGVPGALLTRGPYTPRGYFRAPEHNARAFTTDGWYLSGDIVRRRPDGNLVVAGRDKDMINRGGEKISAEEVENFAYQLDGVEMAAAVAMPDPVLGERLCLYLTVAQGYSIALADVAAVMNTAGVARFKLPERLELIATMPTTKVGKIDKKALRDDIRERLARDHAEPWPPIATTTVLDSAAQEVGPMTASAPLAELDQLYRDFETAHLNPLWTQLGDLMPMTPTAKAVPFVWQWSTLYPLAQRAGGLVPVGRGGERRAIALANPGLGGVPYVTPTLWAAIQYLGPKETAPEHRHSQNAFRFVVEGEGVWTVVNGDPVAMRRGDLLLTPGWHFHGHHNDTDQPMAWIDGLDIPFVHYTDAGFFEFGSDGVTDDSTPDVSRAERLWAHPGLRPLVGLDAEVSSPIAAYRWEHTDAALREQLALEDEGYGATTEPGHAAVRYTNPTTGGDVMPTLRAEFHRLRAGAHTRPCRAVGSAVYQVFEGSGRFRLGDEVSAVGKGDLIVVPSWTQWSIEADTEFDLFMFSDAPIVERLHLDRVHIAEGI